MLRASLYTAGGLLAACALLGATRGPAAAPVSVRTYPAGVCKATDGDTVRCGEERVRMVELDAPEMKGHCRRGRVCAPGDPKASKAHLAAAIQGRPVRVVRYATDRYGRTVGDVRVGRLSMSCWQIKSGHAVRELKWADYGVTRRACP